MILGYLDCSQKNISIDMQRDIINQYTRENLCDVDVFLNEPDIKNIKDNINFKENTLIMANIACLGSKLATIVENIEFLTSNGFELISVKENIKFDSSEENKQLINGIKLSIEIRNSMVSTITVNALKKKKDDGKVLGRCFGYRSTSTILERNRDKITKMYHEGKTKQQIANELGCSIGMIFKYLKEHPEIKKAKG